MDPLDVIAAVRAACEAEDGADPLDEAGVLALAHRGLAGTSHAVDDGGFALVRDGELTLAVAPDHRRHGLAARLLDRVEGARSAWSHADHPAAAALAVRRGWSRDRELWVMRRPSSAPLPELQVPDDVRVRGFDPDDPRDAADVLRVNAAAFAHHPEQGSLDHEGLAERMAESWFDPAGLLLARDADDDRLLGFHWTKRHGAVDGEELGEVYVLGVDPGAQGRGIGRLLTLAGLHHLAERGARAVLLYVESDNTAARHTYERLGFAHAAADTHVQYHAPHDG